MCVLLIGLQKKFVAFTRMNIKSIPEYARMCSVQPLHVLITA